MSDIPIENPRKYGKFDDDLDTLASALAGGGVDSLKRPSAVAAQDDSGEVDASFLRSLRSSDSHYGR